MFKKLNKSTSTEVKYNAVSSIKNIAPEGMQVISPNAISPKNLVESFRLKKLGEMTKRE